MFSSFSYNNKTVAASSSLPAARDKGTTEEPTKTPVPACSEIESKDILEDTVVVESGRGVVFDPPSFGQRNLLRSIKLAVTNVKSRRAARKHFSNIKDSVEPHVFNSVMLGSDGAVPIHGEIQLALTTNFSSNIGGEIQYVLGNDPSIAVDWSSLSNLWMRYRVRKVSMFYMPANRYSKTTTVCVPGWVGCDWENATAWSSGSVAVSQVNAVEFVSLEDPWVKVLKTPSSYPFNQWIDVATPTNTGYLKAFFTGLSANTVYGVVTVKFDIELLGQS